MTFNRDDPNTWPCFKPLIIAHDVGRSTPQPGRIGPRARQASGVT